MDRLGRSLRKRKVGFRSIQEFMDTSTSGGNLIFQVFGALAELERNIIRDRTNAGLASARARGRTGGRPKKLDEQQREFAIRLYIEKTAITDILKTMKISKSTLYIYVQNET